MHVQMLWLWIRRKHLGGFLLYCSWFVSFESEEFAKDTLLDLRTKKRTFRGQSVKARLKTETVVKSYYPVQTAPPIAPVFPLMGYPGYCDINSVGIRSSKVLCINGIFT